MPFVRLASAATRITNDLRCPGADPPRARHRIRGAAAITLQVLAAILTLLICDAARPEALQAQICVESSGPGTVEGMDETGSIPVNSTCPGSQAPPVIFTEPHNGDHLQPARCVAGCFDALVGYSTPAYVVLDQPHSTELVYRSGHARPRVLVQVDARDTSNVSPVKMSIRLRTSSNTWVTFTSGTTEIFYGYVSANHNRLAAQFDAGWLATGAYEYTVLVRSWWSDGTVRESSAPLRVLVVNEGNSDFGAGWTVAGLQRVHVQAGGSVLVTDGAGGAAYFHKACGTCGFTRPRSDFSTLTFNGSVYTRRYPDGSELVFAADGKLSYVRDRLNNQINYAWLASGKLSYVSDALGGQTVFGYNASGRLASIRDPAGRYTYATVTGSGDLTQIKDPSNTVVLQATYDAQHRMLTRTNAAGGVARFVYDAFGRLAADSLPAVALWDGSTRRPTVRYRSMESAVLPASGGTSVSPAAGVNAANVRVVVTNPRGNATQFAVDRWGAPTRVEGPTGQVETAFRNAEGQDTLVVTALADTLTYAWSGPNLTRASSARAGTGKFWTYETAYNQVREASGDQTYELYFFGAAGLADSVKVGSSTARATHLSYDAYGRVTRSIDPEQHKVISEYQTTGARNLASVTTIDPVAGPPGIAPDLMINDTVTQAVYTYDTYGRLSTTRNALGDTTRTGYDVVNRVVSRVGPRGDVTTYGHTALGLYTVTDALNQTYTYRRNALGWVYEQVDPASAVQAYAFDENGNVRRYTNRRGQTASWDFDALDRETLQTADGRTRTISYDQAARRIVVQTPASTDSIRMDAVGRTTEVVTRRGTQRYRTVAEYGIGGDDMNMTLESPFRVMGYQTTSGRLDSMTDLAGGVTTPAYNGDRQASAVQLPSGMQVSVRYGDEHRPNSISYSPALDSLGASYEYDLAGRLRQYNPGGFSGAPPYFYGYDAAGQLTSVQRAGSTVESFAYDLVGNPADNGAVVNTGNRLTSFRGFTLQYDADGNLVRKQGNGVDQRFWWSTLGQLDSLQSGTSTYRYTSDGLGRRIRKNNPSEGVVDFVYWLDSDKLLQERSNATGTVLREYSYYPGVDQPHSFRDAAGNVFYYAMDQRGNVVGAFNAANQVVNRYAYSAFGELTLSVQGAPGPLRFAAREHDAETGLYFNRARYYDPQLRRFISEDPIGLEGGINPYAYVGNAPLNFRDPSGTIPCTTYWIHTGGALAGSFLVITDGCYQDEPSSFIFERPVFTSRVGLRGGGQSQSSSSATTLVPPPAPQCPNTTAQERELARRADHRSAASGTEEGYFVTAFGIFYAPIDGPGVVKTPGTISAVPPSWAGTLIHNHPSGRGISEDDSVYAYTYGVRVVSGSARTNVFGAIDPGGARSTCITLN